MKLKLGKPVMFKDVPVGHAFVRNGSDIAMEKCLGVIDLEGNNAMTAFRRQYRELTQDSIVWPIELDTPSAVDIGSQLAKADHAIDLVDESLRIDRETLAVQQIIMTTLIEIRDMIESACDRGPSS